MDKQQITGRLEEIREELTSIKAQLTEPKLPYQRQIPKEIVFYPNVIEKHYLSAKDIHKGSIRIVKPTPDILTYLACKKSDAWDPKTITCTPNPSVYKTIVPREGKYIEEAEDWIRAYPEIKVRREKEAGVEPRVSDSNDGNDDTVPAPVIEAMGKAEDVS